MNLAQIAGLNSRVAEFDVKMRTARRLMPHVLKLVAPFGQDVKHNMTEVQVQSLYLVVPKANWRVNKIAVFCRWIDVENRLAIDDKEFRKLFDIEFGRSK